MKKQIIIAVCLLCSSLLLISCGNSKLSKSEAKKQIEELINRKPIVLEIAQWISPQEKNLVPLREAKKAGYLDYQEKNGSIEVTLTDKLQSDLLPDNEAHHNREGIYALNAGTRESEIVSISEPAPSSDGKMVCKVVATQKFVQSDLVKKLMSIQGFTEITSLFFSNDGERNEYTFVKMQDGWSLER